MNYAPEVQDRIDRYCAVFLAANGRPCKVIFRDGRYYMRTKGHVGNQPWKASQIERWTANLQRRVAGSMIAPNPSPGDTNG